MPIRKSLNPVETGSTTNVVTQQSTQTVSESPAVEIKRDYIFVPKTELVNNLILEKLDEAIRETKRALLNYEPHFVDLDMYVKALKEDIVELVLLKNHFKKDYK